VTALLECRDVVCGYDKPVLEGIDLEIREGEIVAILGGSGCGKSTLLRTIIGLLPPLSGQVLLFGESLYDLVPEERSELLRRTGTAFQQDALFGSMTLGENVALPLRELTSLPGSLVDEMVRMKLGLVGLGGFETRTPNSLSGGPRTRAARARATILDPQIVFCDEPSAGLDPVVAASIDETLLQFRSALGITLVVVTHMIESVRAIADRAVLLAGGGISAAGTLAELEASTAPDVYGFFHRVPPTPNVTARTQRGFL
jgi:phospholipid/cholesterol/gamma-HCH transport system ATP-binding protein